MIICSNCGHECPDSAKFCASCGTKIEAAPAVEAIEEKTVFAVEEPTVAVEEATVYVGAPEPAAEDAAPAVEESAPIVEEATPIVEEAALPVEEVAAAYVEEPIAEEPAPAVEEAGFYSEPAPEPAPEIFTPAPAASAAPVGDTSKQQSVLDNIYRFLKYRRLACKIAMIFFIIAGIFFLLVGSIFTVIGIVGLIGQEAELGGMGLGMGITYFFCGVLYLPIAVVNLFMQRKADKLMRQVHTNVRPAADYSASIGQIILAYFFNTIAMVFAIIGCVNAKSNAEIIKEIEYNQSLVK